MVGGLHRRARTWALVCMAAFALAACGRSAEPPEVIRPVRSMVVNPDAVAQAVEYPGEVRPRIESRLGFRVGGKIVERRVDVGQAVKAGEVLARLDVRDLALAETAARAARDGADTELALAQADFVRYEDLYKQNFIGKAELDRRRATLDSARARAEQAAASLASQANQASYASLVADAAGVVVGVDAEAGQVVAAGTSVIRVARNGDKEVLITVPEDRIDGVRNLGTAQVSLWARPGRRYAATVREVAAAADPATRTYAVRLTLDGDPPEVALGMTAVAAFVPRGAAHGIRLPLGALAQRDGNTFVWVIDPANMTVRENKVVLAGPSGIDVVVADGLSAGQRVVTAGAHLLAPGQKVKLLEPLVAASSDDAPQADAPKDNPPAGTAR